MSTISKLTIRTALLALSLTLILGVSNGFARQTETVSNATYIVAEGDTFFDLAFRLGMSVDSLATMNPWISGLMQRGDSVEIPARKLARDYVVRPGDTLFELSRRFGVSVEAIREANSMSGTNLQASQKLTIPGQGVGAIESIGSVNTTPVTKGIALVYPSGMINRMLASGARYDPDRYTLSHPDFQLGSIVFVEAEESGGSTFAEVTDRSSRLGQQLFDVSAAVAGHLDLKGESGGTVSVRLVVEGRYGVDGTIDRGRAEEQRMD